MSMTNRYLTSLFSIHAHRVARLEVSDLIAEGLDHTGLQV
jgi:hypothetical protein